MNMHKLLRIPVADLKVLRVTCRKCKASAEVPVDDVRRRLKSDACPFCNADMFSTNGQTSIVQLAHAIGEVTRDKSTVEVELVVPAEE